MFTTDGTGSILAVLFWVHFVLAAMGKSNKKPGSHKEKTKKQKILSKKIQKLAAKVLTACFIDSVLEFANADCKHVVLQLSLFM